MAPANAQGRAQWSAVLVGLVGIGGFAKANRRTKICRACSKRALSTACTVVGLVGIGGFVKANRRTKICRACSKRVLSKARAVVGLVGYGGCLAANRRAKFGAQVRECRALAGVKKQGFGVMLKGVRV